MAMGRPQAEIDWELFEKLIWVPVLTNEQLADMLCVSKKTLQRKVFDKFGMTIDPLRAQKQGPMRNKLFVKMWETAMAGNPACIIWLTKNLFGWTDKVEQRNDNREVTEEKKQEVIGWLRDAKKVVNE